MKGPGATNYEVGGIGGPPGLTRPAATRLVKIDPELALTLKDYMGSDWPRLFGYSSSIVMAPPAGGGGGAGGGAGADWKINYVESGSNGKTTSESFHCLVTGSLFASGGAGGQGSDTPDWYAYPGWYPNSVGVGSGSVGGSGGGGGGSGGIIMIAASKVRISSSAYLIVSGGNGGKGSPGWYGLYIHPGSWPADNPNQGPLDNIIGSAGGGGGGGGAGSGGAIIILSATASTAAGWIPTDIKRFNAANGIGGIGGREWYNYWAPFWGYTLYTRHAFGGSTGVNGINGTAIYIKI